jgi:hypothetical protein
MAEEKEFEIELPVFGGLQFSRGKKESNEALLHFLSQIVDESDRKEIERFFAEAEDVDVVLGDESLCG